MGLASTVPFLGQSGMEIPRCLRGQVPFTKDIKSVGDFVVEGAVDARCNISVDLILVETVLESVKGGGNVVPGLEHFSNDVAVFRVLGSTFSGYIKFHR